MIKELSKNMSILLILLELTVFYMLIYKWLSIHEQLILKGGWLKLCQKFI